jgi:hypothetical protein
MNGFPVSPMSEDVQNVNHIILIDCQKRCYRCKKIQSIKSFNKSKKSKFGVNNECRKCSRYRYRKYSEKNKEKIKLKAKKYRKRHPEKTNAAVFKYRLSNPEKVKQCLFAANLKFNSLHPDRVKAKHLKYRLSHPEKLKQQYKNYKIKNKEKIKLYEKKHRPIKNKLRRERYLKDREKILTKKREWKLSNPEKVKATDKKQRAKPHNKIKHSILSGIRRSMKKGTQGRRWEKLVGYTFIQLKKHLEKQFQPGMTWENYGRNGWHIDHILPISKFNFEKETDEDFKRCWNLKNLQPLWEKENIQKHNKIKKPLQQSLIFKNKNPI